MYHVSVDMFVTLCFSVPPPWCQIPPSQTLPPVHLLTFIGALSLTGSDSLLLSPIWTLPIF